MTSRWRSVIVLLAAGATLACNSPEATRTRGRGAGADVGNHPRGDVQIHAGAAMYHGTRTQGDGIGRPAVIGGAAETGGR